jgi:DNA-binding transcriptional LysR family regulator
MEIELRHLRYFVAVAEERHFGHAAERLHIAQPSLSQQIRRLEEELGAALIDRTSRPIHLTTAGAAFLEDAQVTLDQARRTMERGRRAAAGQLGHLSVAAIPWAYNEILPAALHALRGRAPDVSIDLPPAVGDMVDALLKERLDVGFAAFGGLLVRSRALKVESLLEDPMAAIVPAGHPLAEHAEVSLQDLASQPFVSMARVAAPKLIEEQTALFRKSGLTPNVVQEAPDIHSLLGLIAAGVGVGLHFDSFRRLDRRGLAFIPLEKAPTAPLLIIWREADDRQHLRLFLDSVREVVRSLAPADSGRERKPITPRQHES